MPAQICKHVLGRKFVAAFEVMRTTLKCNYLNHRSLQVCYVLTRGQPFSEAPLTGECRIKDQTGHRQVRIQLLQKEVQGTMRFHEESGL